MDLSIIIPCHNLQKFITPLINSLNMQIFSYDVEIWFVLDDCTDLTEQIIKRKIDTNKYNVFFINCKVHSCGLARNLGLDLSTGKYIWFIDGDDWILGCNTIQKLINTMNDSSFGILKFNYASLTFPQGFKMMVWQYFFKKEVIGNLRFSSIQPHEDTLFMKKIFEQEIQYLQIEDFLYYYNYGREGSNMQQYKTKGIIEL